MKFIGGSYSDIGNYREVNQDAICMRTYSYKDNDMALGAIFDGVGGLYKSEQASQAAANGFEVLFIHLCELIDQGLEEFDILLSHIEDAMDDWNYEVHELNQAQGERSGTTASVLFCLNDKYGIRHVGDSRVYMYSENLLTKLTVDDSVEKEVDGIKRKFLVNCIGKGEDLDFSSSDGVIKPGTLFFYGSDGFYHCTIEEDVRGFVKSFVSGEKPDEICKNAVKEVLSRGESDNVSVGMIYCT